MVKGSGVRLLAGGLVFLVAGARLSAQPSEATGSKRDALCVSEPGKQGGTVLVLDAITGRFALESAAGKTAPSRLPLETITVAVENQNPFLFTHALDVSSEPVGIGPIAAVVGALAQAAGLPAGIVAAAAKPSVGAASAPESGEDEWKPAPSCPGGQINQAIQFLNFLQNRRSEYFSAKADVESAESGYEETEKALREVDALRGALVVPTAACQAIVASAKSLAGKGPILDKSATQIAKGATALARLSSLTTAIKAEITFYEAAFDKTCMVPGVKRLASELTYDVSETTARYAAAGALAAELKTVATRARNVVKTKPSLFWQVRVHHPGDEPARLTVRLRRLPNGEEGDGTLVTEKRFELGDTRRFAVSAGFFGGQFGKRGGELIRYQPVLAPNPQAGEPVEPGKTAPAPTITVVGVERTGRGFALPAGLVHYRPWTSGPYLSFGGGPSGEGGVYALAYILGGSFITGRRLVWTFGTVSGVSQRLPAGLSLDPPSELPAGTSTIATEKERRWGWAAGVSFAIW